MADINNNILDFGEVGQENSIIKVIGVGGGGGNAVNHMYREGIHDVTFVLCNTDNQALNDSPVPIHLQLGKEGLGAGNRPAKAREAAEEEERRKAEEEQKRKEEEEEREAKAKKGPSLTSKLMKWLGTFTEPDE